jgi:hypothetical protein
MLRRAIQYLSIVGFERWLQLTPATLRWPTLLSGLRRKEGYLNFYFLFFVPSMREVIVAQLSAYVTKFQILSINLLRF